MNGIVRWPNKETEIHYTEGHVSHISERDCTSLAVGRPPNALKLRRIGDSHQCLNAIVPDASASSSALGFLRLRAHFFPGMTPPSST